MSKRSAYARTQSGNLVEMKRVRDDPCAYVKVSRLAEYINLRDVFNICNSETIRSGRGSCARAASRTDTPKAGGCPGRSAKLSIQQMPADVAVQAAALGAVRAVELVKPLGVEGGVGRRAQLREAPHYVIAGGGQVSE